MPHDIEDRAGADGSLEAFALQFSRLNVNRREGHESPHKAAMLLAVIDLAEAGDLEANEIRYVPALLDRYVQYFNVVRTQQDHANSYFPFFHLRSEPFWSLVPVPGRDAILTAMTTARGHRNVLENVAHAALDPDLYRLLQHPEARHRLRSALISRWFQAKDEQIRAVLGERQRENALERALRAGEQPDDAAGSARDPVFRRIVLEAYDYRCAATGMRLVVPGVGALIDAAHLIPFAVCRDDSPSNGMALTPTYHRALDSGLIAPGPDFRWHVSPILDSRIDDYRPLRELQGRTVLFQGKARFRPSPEALAWRVEHLRVAE